MMGDSLIAQLGYCRELARLLALPGSPKLSTVGVGSIAAGRRGGLPE